MASGGSSRRTSSGFDFGSDDVLCSYDDFTGQDQANGKRSDPSLKDFHESRMGRPLSSVYGQQDEYPKEEIINAVEKCMKKYADNLLRHLEGISGRLSQLEIYCYKLERSIGEFRADLIRDQSQADTKLNSLEKHLQEVHRSIQILRDKQELADTQKELTKLQLAPKESASSTQSQKGEEAIAPSSISQPPRHENMQDIPNQHLALALPQQIQAAALPARAPEQNQLPVQQQQHQPLDRYSLNQPAQLYPQHSQALQPEIQYRQPRPKIQDSAQAPPPPQQFQVSNQTQNSQLLPQYQQQWSQPSSQPFTQLVVVPAQQPPSQAQHTRPPTPPAYLSYSHQTTPETFAYSSVPQSGGNRPEAVAFSYGGPGSTVTVPNQTQQQASNLGSFVVSHYPSQSNMQGYSPVYSVDGSRVQNYPPGSYQPPSNVAGQNQQVLHHAATQMMRGHPYTEMIEKAANMGFPKDLVVGVVNGMMAESGQPVDFNVLLDRLNSRTSGGSQRVWSG